MQVSEEIALTRDDAAGDARVQARFYRAMRIHANASNALRSLPGAITQRVRELCRALIARLSGPTCLWTPHGTESRRCCCRCMRNFLVQRDLPAFFLFFLTRREKAKIFYYTTTSEQARIPAEFKHINKRRKRN